MNTIRVSGILISMPEFHHEINGIKYYKANLASKRTSGEVDTIPLIFVESKKDKLEIGKSYLASGSINTYRKLASNGKPRLYVNVLTKNIESYRESTDVNEIVFSGEVNKRVNLRKTSLSDIYIADVMLKNVDNPKRSHYVPALFWENQAKILSTFNIGESVQVHARLQSRDYVKTYEDGSQEKRTAYEISVYHFSKE